MSNIKLNLDKDNDGIKCFLRKYKIYIVGCVFFFIGFIAAPKGINEADYDKSLENLSNVKSELEESKQLITSLEAQVNDAKEFLELDEDKKSLVIKNIEEIKAKEEEAKKLEADKKKAEAKAMEKRVTSLFKDIYENFADNVGSSIYAGVVQVIESSGYKYSIQEPTQDDLGTIKVSDNSSNDIVTLMFYPENDIEKLMLVQYDRGGNSIAVSNQFHNISSEYSIHDGTRSTVDSIDDQKKFIFSK